MSENRLAGSATPKQEGFINRLIKGAANFDSLNGEQNTIFQKVLAAETITKDDASYLISGLLKCPEKPRGEMAKPGYYMKPDGTYLVVVENRAKTATYAKRLDVTPAADGGRSRAKWTYAPGEGREVAHMTPMSLTEAAKFGHLHGVCFVCCRALTDPESVKNGIGPVCAKRFGAAPKAQPQLPAKEEPHPTLNLEGLAMRRRRNG